MAASLYMDAVITPNRSLSRRGFRVLIGVLVAVNLVMAGFFVTIGALPIPIFLGLDVLGVWIAFRVNYRAAGQAERVQVSADEVRVLHQLGRTARTIWASPTAFTRVAVEEDEGRRVRLHLSDKALTVARALSPGERAAFGEALERAIGKARAERH